MVLGLFIYRISGIVDQCEYIKILEEVILPRIEEEILLKFQEDNDTKHTSE